MARNRTIPRVCEQCGKPYLAYAKDVRNGTTHCCSHSCAARSRKGKGWSHEEHFWRKVEVPSDPDACWGWKGVFSQSGYARLTYPTKLSAHRLSWQIHNGPIPDGMCVCHRCDNRKCANPAHLFLGTNQENTADRTLKGRGIKGVQCYTAKFTEEDVKAIRARYAAGGITQPELARSYNVSLAAIHKVIRRLTWKHI